MKILPILAAAAVVAGAAYAFNASTAAPAADETGSVAIQVMWDGDRPEPLPALKIGDKESAGCHEGDAHVNAEDRSLLIGDNGGIANVVVQISMKGAKVEPLAEPFVMDQSGCRFEPHIAVVPVGTTVRFKNSDGVNHNVHTYARKNKAINKNIAGGSQEDMVAEKDEIVKVSCDIHPWMNSYLLVTDSPVYGISDATGAVTLDGLAPGEYTVNYWHEKLGKGKSSKVTVAAGATADLGIELNAEGGKKKKGGKRRR